MPSVVRSLPAWGRSRQFNNSGGRLGTRPTPQRQAHSHTTHRNTNSTATPPSARAAGRQQAATPGVGSSASNVTGGTTALPRSLHTVGVPGSFPMQSAQYNSSGGRLGGDELPGDGLQSLIGRQSEVSDCGRRAGVGLAGPGRGSSATSRGGVAQTEVVREGISTEELRQRRLQRFGSQC